MMGSSKKLRTKTDCNKENHKEIKLESKVEKKS